MMAPPKRNAMTMTWSMSALAKACHRLEGKTFTSVAMKPPYSPAWYSAAWAAPERSGNSPALLKTAASDRPMTQATAVVHRKKPTVLRPTAPAFFISPMDRNPSSMENRTTGTTVNFKRLMKMSPKGFRYRSVSAPRPAREHRRPTAAPRTRDARICVERRGVLFICTPLRPDCRARAARSRYF